MKIVLDSNIFFSALLSPANNARMIFFNKNLQLFSCNFLFIEIFKHKGKIHTLSSLSEEALLESLYILINRIRLINPRLIPPSLMREAFSLCVDVDESGTPFVALSLFLDARLLTGDKKLASTLKTKGFDRLITLREL